MDANTPGMPSGSIVLWYGSVASIPAGWILCNGASDTPDLRNKFVVGAGDTYAVDATGGAINHNHPFDGNGHTHTLGSGGDVAEGSDYSEDTSEVEVTGTTDSGDGRPPYHALCYIMRI